VTLRGISIAGVECGPSRVRDKTDILVSVLEKCPGASSFRKQQLDLEVATHDLVGNPGGLQSQRQRMRLGQSTQRCFVSIDVAARNGLILGRSGRAGLGSRLLASTASGW
jgi:hypothetical protein